MKIETITPAEATEQLRAMGISISPDTLRAGLEQEKFPFGLSVETKSGGKWYQIYKKLFEEWIEERAS